MKKVFLAVGLISSLTIFAQDTINKEKTKFRFFGGFESNSQWYTNDKNREINHPEDPFRSNSYLNLNYSYGRWTAGIQGESYASTFQPLARP